MLNAGRRLPVRMVLESFRVADTLKHLSAFIALEPDFYRRVAYTHPDQNPSERGVAWFGDYPGAVSLVAAPAGFLGTVIVAHLVYFQNGLLLKHNRSNHLVIRRTCRLSQAFNHATAFLNFKSFPF